MELGLLIMETKQVIEKIRQLASTVLPLGSSLWLYGSRARGDDNAECDWDLLLLLNRLKITAKDYDLTYSFRELGWELGEELMSIRGSNGKDGRFSLFTRMLKKTKLFCYESE